MTVDAINNRAWVCFILMLIGAGVVMFTSESFTRLLALVFTVVAGITWAECVNKWHEAKYGTGNQAATSPLGSVPSAAQKEH